MSLILVEVTSDTPWALGNIWSSPSLPARAVHGESLPNFLLARQGGSAIARTFRHTWISALGQEKAAWLSEVEIPGGWLRGLVRLVGSRSLGSAAQVCTAGWLPLRLVQCCVHQLNGFGSKWLDLQDPPRQPLGLGGPRPRGGDHPSSLKRPSAPRDNCVCWGNLQAEKRRAHGGSGHAVGGSRNTTPCSVLHLMGHMGSLGSFETPKVSWSGSGLGKRRSLRGLASDIILFPVD